ncbi:MAG: Gfo/Idh/MocA family oxidoreductase [Candidatus Bathyarchaeia archaeon]|jgi:UDP-N-acetylglucosamine 3-dehydrogenase
MNVGLIGCGGVAQNHLRVYQNIKDAKVVAVADINLTKAKAAAGRFGVNRFFSEYVDLLEIKDLDLVDICTPTSTHASIVVDAAKSGHNILVEKPMALSVEECDRMILVTKRQGVKLCVCHNQIFFPAIRQARSIIDSGGRHIVYCRTSLKENPTLVTAPKWNLSPEEKGVLWEAGVHMAYLQLHFLKGISEVYAVGSKVNTQVYNNFAVLLKSSNQAYGLIEVSFIAKHAEAIFEAETSGGKRYLIDGDSNPSLEEMARASLYSDVKRILHHLPSRPIALRSAGGKLGYFAGHYYLISEYLRSMKKDVPPPVRPEDGRKAINLLESIEKSLDTHQVVKSFSSPI